MSDGAHDHEELLARIAVLEQATPKPPAPTRTLFGVAPAPARAGRTEPQEADYLEGVLGRDIDLRYSFSPITNLPTSYSGAPFRFDAPYRESLWSFKLDPTWSAGQIQAWWVPFLDSIPVIQGRVWRFIYYQEPEDNMTAVQYQIAFDTLHMLQNRDDVRLGCNLTSWQFDPANTSANGAAYIPGSADFVGLSLFTNNLDPASPSVKDALGRAHQAALARGVPFALSSIGVSAQQTQSKAEAWLRHLASFAANAAAHGNPLDHVVCYTSNNVPSGWLMTDWFLDGATWTTRAWRDFYDTARAA